MRVRIKPIFYALLTIAITVIILEFSLRVTKSLMVDGVLYVASPSINNTLHQKYGWISPSSRRFEKKDACYGDGVVSYNAAGFRAAPMPQAQSADLLVCILGDSTMQGYQIPDGGHLPHLLAAHLDRLYGDVFVLPLAVGGFGSLQEWMLFDDYCKDLNPDLLIWAWDKNDTTNNSFEADRNSGPNNTRPRPYFENGEIVIRRPYPIQIQDRIDTTITIKLLNGILLRFSIAPLDERNEYLEEGWNVARVMAKRVSDQVENRIALVMETETRAIEMFSELGYTVATYERFPAELTCPTDPHPTTEGHKKMFEAIIPVLDSVLQMPKREVSESAG